MALQPLLELLAQVPVIRGVEPVLPQALDAGGIDALIWLQLEDRRQPLACAVLAHGQPRHVRLALWDLTHAIRRDCPDAIPLLIAPFLSPASQALCKEHEVACMDQQGNARLVFDGVFLDAVHPSPGIACTSPVQTFLDLSAAGERGKEAADHLRSKLLSWSQ